MILMILLAAALIISLAWAIWDECCPSSVPSCHPSPDTRHFEGKTLSDFREFTKDLPGKTPLRIRVLRPQLISVDNLEAGPDGIVIDLELPEDRSHSVL